MKRCGSRAAGGSSPPFLPKTPGWKVCVENCQHVFFWLKMSRIHSRLKTKNPWSSNLPYIFGTKGSVAWYLWQLRGWFQIYIYIYMEPEDKGDGTWKPTSFRWMVPWWFHPPFFYGNDLEAPNWNNQETNGCLGYPEFINAPEIQWAKFRGCSPHGMIPHGKFKDSGNPIKV